MTTLNDSTARFTEANQSGEPASSGTSVTPSDSVVAQVAYGEDSGAGASTDYSRGDHTHGTPALPTPGDIGAAATSHTHAQADVTGLVTALAGKAPTAHTHAESDVTGLTTDLAGKLANSMATNKLLGRGTAGTGVVEEITLGANLALAGTTLNATTWAGVVDVASDVDTPDTGATQPVLSVDVAGGGAEVKLASANGDLVIMDGADRIVSFGRGNGGSAKQARFTGPIFQDFTTTTASGLQEAFRVSAKSDDSSGSPIVALNITNDADSGNDVTATGVFHGLQVNIGAKASAVSAELGGVVAFIKQHGVTTTSAVAFDGSVTIANDALGPCANVVGMNIGLKDDYLGSPNADQCVGLYIRQAGVGTSGWHGGAGGYKYVERVDRPNYWDYITGTIAAPAGTTITGSSTVWTSVPKGADGTCSLLGKWITWTATSGSVVSKRIVSVNSDTSLTVSTIAANETVAAGATYTILTADPWDCLFYGTGLGPTPAVDIFPETVVAPANYTGVMAWQTAQPGNLTRKFGWSWDGVAQFRGLKTTQSSFEPPFVTTRVAASGATAFSDVTGAVDLTGATITFTPAINCRVAILSSADISFTSGSAVAVVKTLVNGSALSGEVLMSLWGAGARLTATQTNTADLTGGTSYTIKLQGSVVGTGEFSAAQTHTGITIVGIGRI